MSSSLPKGWELVETGNVTIVGAGTGFKTDFQGFTDKEIPFYKVSDMNLIGNEMFMYEANNYVDSEDLKVLKAKTFPKNTLIFPKVGAALLTNKRRILTKDSCVDNNIMTLIPIENKINPIFLYSLYLQIDFSDLSNDGALPSLNGSQVKKIMIPLPPLEEQKKIADILSTVDKKIAFVEENINATEELKKALMQKLLTEGIGHTEFKDSELGRIPESWNIVKLKDIFERVTRKNIENNNNALTISAQLGLVNQKEYFNKVVASKNLSNYYLILKGEFAYNKSYSAGYPMGVIKRLDNYEKGVLSTLYICFKINSHNINSNYILQYFSAGSFDKELSSIAQEGARNHGLLNVGVNDFFNLRVILPCIQEQEQIAEILSTVDNKLENLKEKKQYFEELKKGLMQKLLTGEVRV